MTDVVILTDQNNLSQFNENGKSQYGYIEDSILKEALQDQGFKVLRLPWNDTSFDWSTTKSIIFRSTWDYFYHFSEFSIWLKKVSKQTHLINSKNSIHWNIDKHYLLDLQNKGVHIAKSHFIEQNSLTTLKQLHEELGWKETVLKPCISGTARHTYKLHSDNLQDYEVIFKELIKNEAMMLQPFQYSIVEKGEVSMVLFDGQFTHAVLKVAKKGDFRVQDDFGGTVHEYNPTEAEIAFAEHAVKACSTMPSYARVDAVWNDEDQLSISELELIEPELWFRNKPESANELAKYIKSNW